LVRTRRMPQQDSARAYDDKASRNLLAHALTTVSVAACSALTLPIRPG
jgi:hypothetical protein